MRIPLNKQSGYLLVISIVLIIVLAFVARLILNVYINQIQGSVNISKSNSAYNIAISGLDIAKRDVIVNGASCSALGALHDNESLLNGYFTTSGDETSASSTLSTSISSGSTSITLASTSGFAKSGLVKIGNEYIYYSSISGNTLNNAARGKATTTATSHIAGSTVAQNQCRIISSAGMPDLSSSNSSKATVIGMIALESGGSFSVDGKYPSLLTGGTLRLTGNTRLINSGAVLNDSSFSGSTVIAMNSVQITGSSSTMVSNGSGGLTSSSNRNFLNADVITNYSSTKSVYEQYFGTNSQNDLRLKAVSKNQYYASANNSTSVSSINGASNSVIYINNDYRITGNTHITIGTPENPVILFVNGDFDLTGSSSLTIHGLMYVDGDASITGNTRLQGSGSLGVKDNINITGSSRLDLTHAPDQTSLANVYNNLLSGSGAPTMIFNNVGIHLEIH